MGDVTELRESFSSSWFSGGGGLGGWLGFGSVEGWEVFWWGGGARKGVELLRARSNKQGERGEMERLRSYFLILFDPTVKGWDLESEGDHRIQVFHDEREMLL